MKVQPGWWHSTSNTEGHPAPAAGRIGCWMVVGQGQFEESAEDEN